MGHSSNSHVLRMIEFLVREDVLYLEGDLERSDGARLESHLPVALRRVLDCHALDIEDGAALSVLAGLLRDAAQTRRIEIRGAPQLLAHTLYRVNALEHFDWIEVRFDEASTQ